MRYIGALGLLIILALAYAASTHRKQIRPRVIIWGVALQFIFAMSILSESFLSWIGMCIFAYLVFLYIAYQDLSILLHTKKIISSGFIATIFLALVTLFYYADGLGVSKPFFFISCGLWLFLLLIKKRRNVQYVFGMAMTAAIGMMIHRGIYGKSVLANLAIQVGNFLKFTDKGSFFLFGKLADPQYFDQFGYQFAFSVLPIIIFFSAVISILYYLGIMQAIVRTMAKFMTWTMDTSGTETLSCTANIFVGQTEAPLLIKPFLNDLTLSELHAVMVGGFATIAGSVFGGYVRMGVDAGYLIGASIMAAPAALVIAKILIPETGHSKTAGDVKIPAISRADNLLDAITRGVIDGLKLAVNVGAMLLAFLALIELVNSLLAFLDQQIDGRLLSGSLNLATEEYRGCIPGSLNTLFGILFAPLAFALGVPWKEALDVGNLIGIKISMNEFIAYSELVKHIQAQTLSPRAITIATYALCGFANFGSVGIQLGGIGALAPQRRSDLSRIALRAMFGGALASLMTAAMAGILL